MSKWKKKPVVIDAFQWTGGHDQSEDPLWVIEAIKSGSITIGKSGGDLKMFIETMEGVMTARIGDYIIKGVQGEIYPCREEIFLATYEPYGLPTNELREGRPPAFI